MPGGQVCAPASKRSKRSRMCGHGMLPPRRAACHAARHDVPQRLSLLPTPSLPQGLVHTHRPVAVCAPFPSPPVTSPTRHCPYARAAVFFFYFPGFFRGGLFYTKRQSHTACARLGSEQWAPPDRRPAASPCSVAADASAPVSNSICASSPPGQRCTSRLRCPMLLWIRSSSSCCSRTSR
jgi:hypothetical protein